MATVFEGGLLLLAFVLGWAVDIDPIARLTFDPLSLGWGVLGLLPLYIPYTSIPHEGAGWLSELKRLTTRLLGEWLQGCRRIDLFYVACLAGIAEEIFFRGLLQTWMEQHWDTPWALVASNLVFALVHWITPGYALLAGIAGLYLGLSLYLTPEPNLLTPIIIHALYDYLALLGLLRYIRSTQP